MKKILLLTIFSALIISCSKSDRGELIGSKTQKFFPSQPLGMVLIPSGSFLMGMADDDYVKLENAPVSTVSIKAFYMDETEITNNEYRQFVEWVEDSIIRTQLGFFKTKGRGDNRDTLQSNSKLAGKTREILDWRAPLPREIEFVAGKDEYEITNGDIDLNGESIEDLSAEERAHKGIFLSFQYPVLTLLK